MVAQWIDFYNRDARVVEGLPYELAERVRQLGGRDGFSRYVLAEASSSPIPLINFPFNPELLKIAEDEFAQEAGVDMLHSLVVRPLLGDGRVDGVVIQSVLCLVQHGFEIAPFIRGSGADRLIPCPLGRPQSGARVGARGTCRSTLSSNISATVASDAVFLGNEHSDTPLVAVPVALAHLATHDFPHWAARKCCDEIHRFRRLDAAQPLLAESDELVSRYRIPRL